MTSLSSAFVVENLCYSYGTVRSIKNVSCRLETGRFFGLIGPNGSGKSTLLDLLSGHLHPSQGTIHLDNRDIRSYPRKQFARNVSSVPQSFSLNFDYRVEDVVMMGRYPYIPRFSSPSENDHKCVEDALHSLDIYHLKERNVTQLSGGEKQRAMIARCLAQDTDIILLDEVTSNLDISHAVSIMKVMLDIVEREGRTVIGALHDLNIAATFCDELLVLQGGELLKSGKTEEVLSEFLIEDLFQIQSTVSTDYETEKKHIKFCYI
jgi:iron complex transport system ATP-binding protein